MARRTLSNASWACPLCRAYSTLANMSIRNDRRCASLKSEGIKSFSCWLCYINVCPVHLQVAGKDPTGSCTICWDCGKASDERILAHLPKCQRMLPLILPALYRMYQSMLTKLRNQTYCWRSMSNAMFTTWALPRADRPESSAILSAWTSFWYTWPCVGGPITPVNR